MSLDTLGGPAALAARISEIESLVGARRPSAATSTATSAAARGAAFASALGQVVTTAPPAPTGERAVALATEYTGVPYLWGGTDPQRGLDCSGLTQLVFRRLGVELPRVSRDQAKVGEPVASIADARPGDLVFFGSPVHHVGIYAGDGKMVDAPRRGRTVGLHDLWDGVTAIRRVLPGSAQPATLSPLAVGAPTAADPAAVLSGTLPGTLPATLPVTTANALLAARSGFGPGSPGGIMGQAGAAVVPVLTADVAARLAALTGGATVPDVPAPTGAATVGASSPAAPAGAGDWQRAPYAELFRAAGAAHGVDPALLSAVAKAESSYRPTARSHAGAVGLMQIMPATARELGVDPTDPAQAVDGAARLLKSHLKSFDGRVDLALAAYNAGAGAVRRHDGIPPYEETQQYVRRVTDYWKDLR